MENDVETFSRIGVEDRNIISVLGSMIIFIFMFWLSQTVYQFLRPFRQASYRVRRVLNYVKVDSAYRTIIMIFFLETYMDLLMGGFVAVENGVYLTDGNNWGIFGSLTMSDQFSIVLGYLIYIGSMLLPFIVMYILDTKYRSRYEFQDRKVRFNYFYDFLFEGMKTNTRGYMQYYSLFLLRKMIYCFATYHFSDEIYCLT
jgi:hypothetical protein